MERLEIVFRADASVELRTITEIRARPDGDRSGDTDRGLRRRLEQVELQILDGEDPWADRFARLNAAEETFQWRREAGRLASAERTARLEDPRRLETFFSDTAVLPRVLQEDGRGTFALYPGQSNRASRDQHQRVMEALEEWPGHIAEELRSAEAVYRYLDANPGRARPVLTAVYGDAFDTEGEGTPPESELRDRELELTDALRDAIDGVVQVVVLDRQEGYTLDELSRLVFDPFPARLTVRVPGEIVELEGFLETGKEGTVDVPGLSLWASFQALEGLWILPDPALTKVRLAVADDPDAAFEEIVRSPRRLPGPPPTAGEVRGEIEQLLRPEAAYRVAWRTATD